LRAITTAGGPLYIFDALDATDVDGLGRLWQADETMTYPGGGQTSRAYTYAYDMRSQLTYARATNVGVLNWMEETFVYAPDGNIDRHTRTVPDDNGNPVHYVTNYTYTNSGVSDIMAGASGADPFTLTNDLNGNTTKLPTTSSNDTVEYNWDNRMRSAQKDNAWLYVKYDPTGNRVWMDSSIRGTKRLIVDIVGGLPVILCEVDQATGSLEKSYIHADGQILSQVSHEAQGTDVYYYVHDRLGSVRMVVGYDGQTASVANSYAYRPFGAFYEGECVETVDNPFCFTGQWRDAEIGQYYLRARQYDPTMMRFTTRDPVRGRWQEPLTLHRYLYCGNEPVNRTDKDGRWAIIIGGEISGTLSAGLLGQAAKTGLRALAKGALGIHSLMRQALIGLLAAQIDIGIGGSAGLACVFGKGNDGYFFGTMYWAAGGISLSNGSGYSAGATFGFSPNAQRLQDLSGNYTEFGGSVTVKAPVGSMFLGATVGFSYSRGDNGIDLYSVTAGPGYWTWVTGFEGHVYRGRAWVEEW